MPGISATEEVQQHPEYLFRVQCRSSSLGERITRTRVDIVPAPSEYIEFANLFRHYSTETAKARGKAKCLKVCKNYSHRSFVSPSLVMS